MNPSNPLLHCLRRPVLAGLALALGLASTAQAFVFALGDVKGNFDTTVSIGSSYRLNDPNPAFYGITNTFGGVKGQQRSVNADDGNLNYNAGLSSLLVKINSDLLLRYKNTGLFVRGFVFNDFVNSNGTRARTPLSDEAKDIVAEGGELLDAYVYFNEDIGGMPTTFRFGRQVLSWGESTFIPNGVNSINPIDVAKLRTPGSELKEALRPLTLASASIGISEELSLEAFYLFDWENTRVDPPGTYFSTNDFVAKGGSNKVYLGFGAIPDYSTLGAIPRGPDSEPGDSGQYGINLKWMAHGLNETEFGLYYMNYHSRLPVISARTPSSPINTALVVSDSAAALQSSTVYMAGLAAAVGPAGVPQAMTTLIGATLLGVPASALPPALQPFYAPTAAVTGQVSQREFLVSAATGRYLIEFPEDIQLVGASFNTSLSGIALQGELSYRNNQPLQVDDVELLFAALSPLSSRYANNNQITRGTAIPLNTYVPGYRRLKVWTGQMTATWVGRGVLGADQTTLLGEAGFVQADLPEKNSLRFDGSGTFVGGDVNYMNNSGSNASGVPPLSEPAAAFADRFSWGYQLVGRLDYNNAFKGVNVSPLVIFAHDQAGNTPLPLGNFVRGRKTVTVGAEFTFQNAWAFDLRYVNFFGASRYNLLSDRDYVSCNLKYSF
jgi:hypothetical protein